MLCKLHTPECLQRWGSEERPAKLALDREEDLTTRRERRSRMRATRRSLGSPRLLHDWHPCQWLSLVYISLLLRVTQVHTQPPHAAPIPQQVAAPSPVTEQASCPTLRVSILTKPLVQEATTSCRKHTKNNRSLSPSPSSWLSGPPTNQSLSPSPSPSVSGPAPAYDGVGHIDGKCCKSIASLFVLVVADSVALLPGHLVVPIATQCFDSVVDAVSSHLAAPSDGHAAVLPDQIRPCGNLSLFALLTDISSPEAYHSQGKAPDPHQDRSPQLATLRQNCSTLSDTTGCRACLSQMDDTAETLLGEQRSAQDLEFQACSLSVLLYVVANYPDGIRFPGALPCLFDLQNRDREPTTSMWAMIVEHAAVALLPLLCAIALVVRRCIRNRRSSRSMAMATAAAGTKLYRLLLDGGWDASSGAAPLFTFTLAEIRTATDNFAEERVVGVGGFGCVYRGVLPDGRRVAVKRVTDTTGHADAQFANEVHVISSIRHRNLVVLLGWCVAQEVEHGQLHHERLLVYDYMENGALRVDTRRG